MRSLYTKQQVKSHICCIFIFWQCFYQFWAEIFQFKNRLHFGPDMYNIHIILKADKYWTKISYILLKTTCIEQWNNYFWSLGLGNCDIAFQNLNVSRNAFFFTSSKHNDIFKAVGKVSVITYFKIMSSIRLYIGWQCLSNMRDIFCTIEKKNQSSIRLLCRVDLFTLKTSCLYVLCHCIFWRI